MRIGRAALAGMLGTLVALSIAWAHEERLVVGRVERVDLERGVLVVQDPERDRTVRVIVDADTEVRRCRAGLGLRGVKPGAKVRVKYLDRASGPLETLSLLVLQRGK